MENYIASVFRDTWQCLMKLYEIERIIFNLTVLHPSTDLLLKA